MATFTSWDALRESAKDALANWVAGDSTVKSFSKGERKLEYRTFDDLVGLIEKTYTLEQLETIGDPASMTAYGSFRRF